MILFRNSKFDKKYIYVLLSAFFLNYIVGLHAEIVTDGSLGRSVELSGKNYQITAELGQQLGSNLFHSFQLFNLNADESAIFSGAGSVQNIIARVTGGSSSQINGLIRSTVPNADLYLINPYGVMFGQNAKLDLQGGFHVSTADYLKLQDGGYFDAHNPTHSLLSVAPVASFGFANTPTNIQVHGSQLAITPLNELSLIAGNLNLNQAQLTAESGQINLVSVASPGEVIAKMAKSSDTSSFSQLGQIQITDSQIETSGYPSGGISIRGGQLQMFDSRIHAHNFGHNSGKGIDIELQDSMTMTSENTSGYQQASNIDIPGIISDTFSLGQAGDVTINVPHLQLRHSLIDISSRGEGYGGNLDLKTQQLSLGEGAGIVSYSFSSGNGGQIHIKATDRLELIDQRIFTTAEETSKNAITAILTSNFGSGNGGHITIDAPAVKLAGGYIASNIFGQGHGGAIRINIREMELLNGGVISSANLPQATGNSGEIKLNVSDTLKISGFRPGFIAEGPLVLYNLQSGISPGTFGSGKGGLLDITAKNLIIGDYATVGSLTMGVGDAGDMMINVDNLYLQQGGILANSSGGIAGGKLFLATGTGGHLTVIAKEDIVIEGRNPLNPSSIATNTFLSGQGGDIDLQANHLILRNGGAITANSLGTGNAGNIRITANKIELSSSGEITSAALQAVGGNLTMTVGTLLYLQNSQITTSVTTGLGSGGNITIEQPQFVVLNQAQIKAQADTGHGGNIQMAAQHFVPSSDSLISASSNLGIDGSITISSPTEDVGNQVLNLSTNFINAADLFPLSCAARIADQRPSQFMRPFTLVIKPRFHNDAPEDVRPSSHPDIEKFSAQ